MPRNLSSLSTHLTGPVDSLVSMQINRRLSSILITPATTALAGVDLQPLPTRHIAMSGVATEA